jgi:hypothetical protein
MLAWSHRGQQAISLSFTIRFRGSLSIPSDIAQHVDELERIVLARFVAFNILR